MEIDWKKLEKEFEDVAPKTYKVTEEVCKAVKLAREKRVIWRDIVVIINKHFNMEFSENTLRKGFSNWESRHRE